MEIKVNYTPQDILEAQKLHYLKGIKYSLVGPLIFAVVIAVLIILLFTNFNVSDRVIASSAVQISIVFIVLSVGYYFFYLKYYSKSVLKKTPAFNSLTTFEINEEGIRSSSELQNGITKWGVFIRAAHNDKVIILYPAPNIFWVIPRRIVSEQEWKYIVDLAETKIENKEART